MQSRPIPNHLMDVRRTLWKRLAELADIEIMTEAEKYEEQILSHEFWSWQPVEAVLRPDVHKLPWGVQDTHPIQCRIMWTVHVNRCIQPEDYWAKWIEMR